MKATIRRLPRTIVVPPTISGRTILLGCRSIRSVGSSTAAAGVWGHPAPSALPMPPSSLPQAVALLPLPTPQAMPAGGSSRSLLPASHPPLWDSFSTASGAGPVLLAGPLAPPASRRRWSRQSSTPSPDRPPHLQPPEPEPALSEVPISRQHPQRSFANRACVWQLAAGRPT